MSVLAVEEDLRRSIKPPELVEAAGLKRVKADRNVYLDSTDRKIRRSTGELAPGYRDLVSVFFWRCQRLHTTMLFFTTHTYTH